MPFLFRYGKWKFFDCTEKSRTSVKFSQVVLAVMDYRQLMNKDTHLYLCPTFCTSSSAHNAAYVSITR